jgi:hypothetical protein
MPVLMKDREKLALVDQRLSDLPPELREHFKESLHHNRSVLKRLAKM